MTPARPDADAPPPRPRKKSASKKKSGRKSRSRSTVVAPVPRPEAGVPRGDTIRLRTGQELPRGAASGGRGPEPGHGGRPPNLLRSNLTDVLAKGVPAIEAIAMGMLVERKRFRVLDLLPYVELECPNCGVEGARESLKAKLRSVDDIFQTIECDVSASAADRIRALDLAGKYGPGVVKQIGVEVVRDKIVETLDLLRERLDPKMFDELRPLLRTIWVVKAA